GDDAEVSQWCFHGRCYRFGDRDDGLPGVFRSRDKLMLRDETGAETQTSVWSDLPIPGAHNLKNAMAAAAAGLALGVPLAAIERGLHDVTPLPHRLQFVGEWRGRRFYNDSLATTPESALAALDAFAEPVVLLAGGSDKGVDLSNLAGGIATGTKAVALMGETGESLGRLVELKRETDCPVVRECDSFEQAFGWAAEQSAPGDVVLLSPGCASFDWFRNFAERGERFVAFVREIQNHATMPTRLP
ncbi:MAG: glutamate ligase domain-containing protein, partial [Planctomycetaceae bacterium]